MARNWDWISEMDLPKAAPERLKKRDELVRRLQEDLAEDQLIYREEDTVVYECDGLHDKVRRAVHVVLHCLKFLLRLEPE